MGEFNELRWSELPDQWTDDHERLLDRTLPSRRFIAFAEWIKARSWGSITPGSFWEAINEASDELFGVSVVDAMDRQISSAERKVSSALEMIAPTQSVHPSVIAIAAHVQQRRRLHGLLSAAPLRLLDPHEYWADLGNSEVRMPADWFLTSKSGFDDVPMGLVEFQSPMYKPSPGDRPRFLKQDPVGHADTQNTDEVFSIAARFLVRGAISDAWVGPELDWARNFMATQTRALVIPPYDGLRI